MMPHEFELLESSMTDEDLDTLDSTWDRLHKHWEFCVGDGGIYWFLHPESKSGGIRCSNDGCDFFIGLPLRVGAYLVGCLDMREMGLLGDSIGETE